MTVVTIVGMVAGALLIVVAVTVFLLKREFPSGGVGVTAFGLVLIGMSQWSTIKINAGGATLELIQRTAAATAEVAAQAQQAAAAVDTTRQQVMALANQLEARHVLPAQSLQAIRRSLDAAPRVDMTVLLKARQTLGNIKNP